MIASADTERIGGDRMFGQGGRDGHSTFFDDTVILDWLRLIADHI